jgi:hypothetical protein
MTTTMTISWCPRSGATTASGDDDGDNDAIDGEIVSEVSADVAELLADWDED